ncbi:hypothetical protein LOK49_LG05G03141 [Camellia lanceoleosa]|uniref:Uncharacterized protein n=1 Tax=Camellia lanceoleosa TaxID=1840588 RepID=A0ACC0HKW4_9ERIC|nr:hypothetical protein LOK49_LG05G03141 [Camellia lanceoleosa]
MFPSSPIVFNTKQINNNKHVPVCQHSQARTRPQQTALFSSHRKAKLEISKGIVKQDLLGILVNVNLILSSNGLAIGLVILPSYFFCGYN